ncbi:cathepsin L precursor [Planoprotostelium fungivorum]|uniref:Cathepsin L n=1 Tax=Planoprotostelium fungivorum TaxID=1890364 RepID=A0A2P6N4J1_9EUKA|nr:cathepsin L precursor [Planoprotostelium fungivorum]
MLSPNILEEICRGSRQRYPIVAKTGKRENIQLDSSHYLKFAVAQLSEMVTFHKSQKELRDMFSGTSLSINKYNQIASYLHPPWETIWPMVNRNFETCIIPGGYATLDETMWARQREDPRIVCIQRKPDRIGWKCITMAVKMPTQAGRICFYFVRRELFLNLCRARRKTNRRIHSSNTAHRSAMRVFVFFLFGLVLTAALIDHQTKEEFEGFVLKYERRYIHAAEYAKRLGIFTVNKLKNIEHNLRYANGEVGWKAGVTQFSDLTVEEFKKLFTGAQSNLNSTVNPPSNSHKKSDKRGLVDWRRRGLVSTVKNQGQCGSCWSLAATAAVLETCVGISTKKMYNASAYYLQDCFGDARCSGSDVDVAMMYMHRAGVYLTKDYPRAVGECQSLNKTMLWAGDISYGNDEASVGTFLQTGAVVVRIDATPLQSYKSGVINAPTAKKHDHAVVVVALTTDCDGVSNQCWVIKNSWGTRWGERGFFRVARGIASMGLGPQGVTAVTDCTVGGSEDVRGILLWLTFILFTGLIIDHLAEASIQAWITVTVEFCLEKQVQGRRCHQSGRCSLLLDPTHHATEAYANLFLSEVDVYEENLSITGLEGQINRLQGELRAQDILSVDQMAQIERENEELKTKNDQLERQNRLSENKIAVIERENEASKASTENLKAENEALKASTEALKAENEALKASTENLKAENETLKASTEALKAENEALKEQMQIVKNLHAEIELLSRKAQDVIQTMEQSAQQNA